MGPFFLSFIGIVLMGVQTGFLCVWMGSMITGTVWRVVGTVVCLLTAAGLTMLEIAVLSKTGMITRKTRRTRASR